jgi:hypothetical protein
MIIGINTKFECISCGNIINHNQVLLSKGKYNYFESPKKCGCGNQKNFNLLDFKPMEVSIYDKEEKENENTKE